MLELTPVKIADYSLRRLSIDDADIVQTLLESCEDFQLLVEGHPVHAGAGAEVFTDVPPGLNAEDKLVLGLFDQADDLKGLVDFLPAYPDDKTWWIGLQLLLTDIRGRGIGRQLTDHLVEIAKTNQAEAVMLGVVEENTDGYAFWLKNGFSWVRTTDPRPFGAKMQKVLVMRRTLT